MGRPNILYTAFVAQDYFSTPVKKMGTSVKGLATITSVASAKMVASMQKVSASATEIGMAGTAIGLGIAVPFGLATKAAINFASEMGDVSTLVNTTAEDMDGMADAVLRLSQKIPKPIHDLTESLYQIRSAGIGAADAMHDLEVSGKLSVAGLSTATESTKALTSAIVSFKGEALTADQIANSLFLTVKQGKTKMDAINESFGAVADIVSESNVKLDDFLSVVAAATNTGMDASQAMLNLRQFIIALKKPSSEMTDVLTSMGITGADAGQQMIDKYKTIGAIMNALKEAAPAAQDNINKALGRAQALTLYTAITGNLQGQYTKNLKERADNTNALTVAFDKQSDQAAKKLQIFKNEVTALGISIGNILIPPLTKTVSILTPVINGVASFAKEHKFLTGVVVDSIATIGLFAAVTGVAGLAVGGLTKGVKLLTVAEGLLNGVVGTYNFLTTYAAVKTGRLTGAMLSSRSAILGARVAMGEYNMELKNAGVLSLALLTTMKAISQQKDQENEEKKLNPFGLNMGGTANDNRASLNKLGASDADFEKWQKAYSQKKYKDWQQRMDDQGLMGYVNDPFGKAVREIERHRDDTKSTIPGATSIPNVDSTRNSIDKFYQDLNKSDTTGGQPTSANYTPKSGMQNITITLENNSGMTASVKQNSGGTAQAVPIKIVSTTSKQPKQAMV